MIQRINADSKRPQGIILCPTRELAMQAAEEMLERYPDADGVVASVGPVLEVVVDGGRSVFARTLVGGYGPLDGRRKCGDFREDLGAGAALF